MTLWPDTPTPEAIRQSRVASGLTQAQAAILLRLAHGVRWAEYEAGTRNMPVISWMYWLHVTGLRPIPPARSCPPVPFSSAGQTPLPHPPTG